LELKDLIVLSLVCAMGAISPGPSLAVVIRNTISGGRFQGVMTGIGHGIGIGIYAFMAVMGLSSLLINNENIFKTFQLAGAIILLWIAYKMIINKPSEVSNENITRGRGFIEGFMIAFLNPKILVFLVAVFSQFINSDINILDRAIIAIMASVIDMVWYVLVALLLAGTSLIDNFRSNAVLIDRSIGAILILISLFLINQTIN
jgi:threonine/homoserine/homoserine lactone efflux protein